MSLRAALAALLLAAACSRGGPVAPAGPRPVARVNGEPVSAEAVRRELAQLAVGDAPAAPEVRRRALDAAVERALLLGAARARGVAVRDEDVERAFAALRAEYPDAAFDELLAQQKTTAAELKARLRDQLAVERVVAEEVAKVRVPDADVRAHYDGHLADFTRGEQVRALQIVTRTREEAERARVDVTRRGAPFAEVARRASIAPEAREGGELGWFGKDSGMPEVFLSCLGLQKNTVSPVVPSPYGFHVFKVIDRRPAARRPFDEVAAEIGGKLLAERRAKVQEEFLASLRSGAKIEIDEAAYEAAVRETPTP